MAFLLTGCARSDTLWMVTQDHCMTNYDLRRDPAPYQQIYQPQG
ncbi:CDP-diacylglycerol pyrophosphatase|nr:CDP-diacylglycerol pyrophosphatase [Candidatus Pantoea persica]